MADEDWIIGVNPGSLEAGVADLLLAERGYKRFRCELDCGEEALVGPPGQEIKRRNNSRVVCDVCQRLAIQSGELIHVPATSLGGGRLL